MPKSTPAGPKAPGAASETRSIAAIAASTASRTTPSSGSRVFVNQAYAAQAHQSAPRSSRPRRRPPHVGLCEKKLVTCVMAKTTTRSKKSSRGVTRWSRSACRSSMRKHLLARSAIGQSLQVFRVPGPLHRDLGGGALDVAEIVRRELDVDYADVLLQALQPAGAGDGN